LEKKATAAAHIQKRSRFLIILQDIKYNPIDIRPTSRHLVFVVVIEIAILIVGYDGFYIFFAPYKDKITGWTTVIGPTVEGKIKVAHSPAIRAIDFFITSG
jgi:hypothetical protein